MYLGQTQLFVVTHSNLKKKTSIEASIWVAYCNLKSISFDKTVHYYRIGGMNFDVKMRQSRVGVLHVSFNCYCYLKHNA